jgi:uncharacterized protein (DUF1697 family)
LTLSSAEQPLEYTAAAEKMGYSEADMVIAVVLLRGINVGGRHMIPMKQLGELCREAGAAEARTLLQSGNVVVRIEGLKLKNYGRRLEDAIEAALGFRPAVVIRTPDQLAAVAASSPFAGQSGLDPAKLAVLFLSGDPTPAARAAVDALSCESEIVRMGGREVYVYFRNGIGRPKVTAALIEKTAQCSATGRNWNTVKKLLEMASATGAGG